MFPGSSGKSIFQEVRAVCQCTAPGHIHGPGVGRWGAGGRGGMAVGGKVESRRPVEAPLVGSRPDPGPGGSRSPRFPEVPRGLRGPGREAWPAPGLGPPHKAPLFPARRRGDVTLSLSFVSGRLLAPLPVVNDGKQVFLEINQRLFPRSRADPWRPGPRARPSWAQRQPPGEMRGRQLLISPRTRKGRKDRNEIKIKIQQVPLAFLGSDRAELGMFVRRPQQ